MDYYDADDSKKPDKITPLCNPKCEGHVYDVLVLYDFLVIFLILPNVFLRPLFLKGFHAARSIKSAAFNSPIPSVHFENSAF